MLEIGYLAGTYLAQLCGELVRGTEEDTQELPRLAMVTREHGRVRGRNVALHDTLIETVHSWFDTASAEPFPMVGFRYGGFQVFVAQRDLPGLAVAVRWEVEVSGAVVRLSTPLVVPVEGIDPSVDTLLLEGIRAGIEGADVSYTIELDAYDTEISFDDLDEDDDEDEDVDEPLPYAPLAERDGQAAGRIAGQLVAVALDMIAEGKDAAPSGFEWRDGPDGKCDLLMFDDDLRAFEWIVKTRAYNPVAVMHDTERNNVCVVVPCQTGAKSFPVTVLIDYQRGERFTYSIRFTVMDQADAWFGDELSAGIQATLASRATGRA